MTNSPVAAAQARRKARAQARRRVFRREKHRIVAHIEQRAAEGLAELDAPISAEQGLVLEARVINGEVVVDVPPAPSRRRTRPK